MSVALEKRNTRQSQAADGRLKAAAFVPVCFARMPNDALTGLTLHLRKVDVQGAESFTLYAAPGTPFSAEHRRRLQELGAAFLYLPAEEQAELRRRLGLLMERVAEDTGIDLVERCEIIYESAHELVDEAFTAPEVLSAVPRLQKAAAAIVALHQENRDVFTHFFAAARHDACAATHATNAAVWLPALAMAQGETQVPALQALCLGALLYDVGMTLLPKAIRTSKTKLTGVEKQKLREHPELAAQLLRSVAGVPAVVVTMAAQHHERLDGSGYPRGITFDRIVPAARWIAVVDTYDALTSFRPYRSAGVAPGAALAVLRKEAVHHYDSAVVEAWATLVQQATPDSGDLQAGAGGVCRRRFQRFAVKCPATLQRLELVQGMWTGRETIEAVAHNLSRGGLGLISRERLVPGHYYRAKLRRKDGLVQQLELMVVRSSVYGGEGFESGTRFVDLAREAAPVPDGEFV